MGFRCPVCKVDFGRDRDAWRGHLDQAHSGLGSDILNAVVAAAEETTLKLFRVYDGEEYYCIAHESETALREDDTLPGYCIEIIESIVEVGLDEVFRICLVDGPDDGEVYPTEPFQEQGQWFVKATVKEWLSCAKLGDMIATSVY